MDEAFTNTEINLMMESNVPHFNYLAKTGEKNLLTKISSFKQL